jgi:hypothetical protein
VSVPFDPASPLRKERMVRTVPRDRGSSLASITADFCNTICHKRTHAPQQKPHAWNTPLGSVPFKAGDDAKVIAGQLLRARSRGARVGALYHSHYHSHYHSYHSRITPCGRNLTHQVCYTRRSENRIDPQLNIVWKWSRRRVPAMGSVRVSKISATPAGP